jgi:hypothetical protein
MLHFLTCLLVDGSESNAAEKSVSELMSAAKVHADVKRCYAVQSTCSLRCTTYHLANVYLLHDIH